MENVYQTYLSFVASLPSPCCLLLTDRHQTPRTLSETEFSASTVKAISTPGNTP